MHDVIKNFIASCILSKKVNNEKAIFYLDVLRKEHAIFKLTGYLTFIIASSALFRTSNPLKSEHYMCDKIDNLILLAPSFCPKKLLIGT